MDVYLEVGRKRVFAGAIEWPGWCRSGRDEESALGVLLDYAPRYAAVAKSVSVDFTAPTGVTDLRVVERLAGDSTTDFGAPGGIPQADHETLAEPELELLLALLESCSRALESAAEAAEGKQLATGPRGGGRSLEKIREHVREADRSYSLRLGGPTADFNEAVRARWRGEVADVGPRGGVRWPTRYAIRRAAWHILDHAWEIEDRSGAGLS